MTPDGSHPEEGIPRLGLPSDGSPADRAFVDLEREVLEQVFRFAPGYAVMLGIHSYDGLLPDLAPASVEAWRRGTERLLGRLEATVPTDLSSPRRLDRELLRLRLRSDLFDLIDYPYLDRLPLAYVGPLELVPYLARPYALAPHRAQAMVRALGGAPALLATGRARLKGPLPAAFVRVSLAMAEGLIPHFRESEAFVKEQAPGELPAYRRAREEAEASTTAFVDHLKAALATANEAFALGPALFQKLLYVREGVRASWAEVLRTGWENLRANQARVAELARARVPPATPEAIMEDLGRDRPTSASLLPEAEHFVEELRTFVRERDLISIPEPEHCRVEPTPLVDRAWTTASMDPPGPFETSAHEGVYHVTPVEEDWDEAKREQWLASFNRPVLRNVTAHEVYPGHYVQFLHFRAHAATMTRRVYISGAFTEGWAHYTEQLMIEQGLHAESPFAELAELQDALLRNVRLVASIGMHAQGMTVAEATGLFVKEAHMEPFPAEREAVRGTFNPEYFGYTLGKLEILRVRRIYRDRHPATSLRAFHDLLLSFGAPPVGFLEPLLLGQPIPAGPDPAERARPGAVRADR